MTDAPERFTLDVQLCFELYAASRAMTACYRPGLEAIGLTYSQYLVMLVLWERGDTTLGALSAALHLDSGTLSPMIKRLERGGLVSRRRNVDDERSLVVTCTPAGQALFQPARDVQAQVEASTGLSGPRLAELRHDLRQLADRLRDAAGPPS